MALLDITDVSHCKLDGQALWGGRLEVPQRGYQGDTHALDLIGWVLGKRAPAVAVEWEFKGAHQRRLPLNISRADVAKVYTDVVGVDKSGFRNRLSVLGVPLEFEASLSAVLQDNTRVPMVQVRGRREPVESAVRPRFRPLLLTTFGRTGSTWLTALLARAPQILAYRPFQFEPRVAPYWMEVLRTLAEPASYMQAVAPELYGPDWWTGSRRFAPADPGTVEPVLLEELGRRNPERLVAFFQGQIDYFYVRVAELQDQADATYFLEKYPPAPVIQNLLLELYPEARELFLIRDLRDVVCSILAFNKKHPQARFYADRAHNDREIIREVRNEASVMLQLWERHHRVGHLLRYEDLIRRPEESLQGVLNHLQLDSSLEAVRQMMEQALATMPNMQQQHQTSRDAHASIERWRFDLSPDLQSACRDTFGGLLGAFGYAEA
jgi:hypothetical protein